MTTIFMQCGYLALHNMGSDKAITVSENMMRTTVSTGMSLLTKQAKAKLLLSDNIGYLALILHKENDTSFTMFVVSK